MPSPLVLGLVLALAQRTPSWLLTLAVREVVEFIRSTPLVLQIFFVFYVGPQFGIRLSPWVARHDRHRPALRGLSLRGLPRRHRERAEGPVGGVPGR